MVVAESSRGTADLIVECLENEGVTHVFGIPGEENIRLVEAISRSSIRYVLMRQEQGAALEGEEPLAVNVPRPDEPSPGQVERAAALLRAAHAPIVLAGHGAARAAGPGRRHPDLGGRRLRADQLEDGPGNRP